MPARPQKTPPARRRGGDVPLWPLSLLALVALGVVVWFAGGSRPPAGPDDRERLTAALALKKEGMVAFRAWNRARQDRDSEAELRHHREAHGLLTGAMDALNALLDGYRVGGGELPAEYEGYEGELTEIARCLVDLEKGARIR